MDLGGFILSRGVTHASERESKAVTGLQEGLPLQSVSLAGDTGYSDGRLRYLLEERDITAYIYRCLQLPSLVHVQLGRNLHCVQKPAPCDRPRRRPRPLAKSRALRPSACLPKEAPYGHRFVPRRRRSPRNPLRPQTPHPPPPPRLGQACPHPARRDHPRGPHRVPQRPMAALHELLETTGRPSEASNAHRRGSGGYRHQLHATDSEAQTWENPKAYYVAEHRLARWQRAQARRTHGSRGWWEARRHIDHLHRRIAELRHHAVHQMTSQLVHKFQSLVIEDLNVAGLMKGKAPKAQADANSSTKAGNIDVRSYSPHGFIHPARHNPTEDSLTFGASLR